MQHGQADVISLLIRKGANWRATCKHNDLDTTALELAVRMLNLKAVKLLLPHVRTDVA